MEIRKYTFKELTNELLYAIIKLRVDVFVVEQNCAYAELDDKDQESMHYLGLVEGRVVAYLRAYVPAADTAAIGRIVTRSEHRSQGHSAQLIKNAMNEISQDNDISKIYLQAQEHLVPYYSKFGFNPVSDAYDWDGIPHVDMECQIQS